MENKYKLTLTDSNGIVIDSFELFLGTEEFYDGNVYTLNINNSFDSDYLIKSLKIEIEKNNKKLDNNS